MALARDLQGLPVDPTGRGGWPPAPEPRFVGVLVEAWMAIPERADGAKPTAHGTRLRHSEAGKCARALALKAAGFPASDPMDAAGYWVTGLGTEIHEAWQAALVERFGKDNVRTEGKVRLPHLDASGHFDALIHFDATGSHTLIELKTTGGFSFKKKVGDRYAAEGPSTDHLRQVALNALAAEAEYGIEIDEVVVGYIATEAISKGQAQRSGIGEIGRFAAEWTLTREEWLPWAEAERDRFGGILDLLDQGELAACKIPDPEIPAHALITDPAKGVWTVKGDDGLILNTGSTWRCGYCPQQATCASIGEPGRISIDEARERVAAKQDGAAA